GYGVILNTVPQPPEQFTPLLPPKNVVPYSVPPTLIRPAKGEPPSLPPWKGCTTFSTPVTRFSEKTVPQVPPAAGQFRKPPPARVVPYRVPPMLIRPAAGWAPSWPPEKE